MTNPNFWLIMTFVGVIATGFFQLKYNLAKDVQAKARDKILQDRLKPFEQFANIKYPGMETDAALDKLYREIQEVQKETALLNKRMAHQNKINTNVGVLLGKDIATKRNIAIGGIRIVMETSNNVVVSDNGEPVLSVQIKDNKLYVSVIILGNNGDLIAEISENEWKLNKNQYFDRNYTDSALEVRDGLGNIVLQVVNFGDVIHFAGTFYTKEGNVVSFVPTEDSTAVIEVRPSVRDLQFRIDPIFEYPSELHFGSCPGIGKLEKIVRSGSSIFSFGNSVDIGVQSKKDGSIRLI